MASGEVEVFSSNRTCPYSSPSIFTFLKISNGIPILIFLPAFTLEAIIRHCFEQYFVWFVAGSKLP